MVYWWVNHWLTYCTGGYITAVPRRVVCGAPLSSLLFICVDVAFVLHFSAHMSASASLAFSGHSGSATHQLPLFSSPKLLCARLSTCTSFPPHSTYYFSPDLSWVICLFVSLRSFVFLSIKFFIIYAVWCHSHLGSNTQLISGQIHQKLQSLCLN